MHTSVLWMVLVGGLEVRKKVPHINRVVLICCIVKGCTFILSRIMALRGNVERPGRVLEPAPDALSTRSSRIKSACLRAKGGLW